METKKEFINAESLTKLGFYETIGGEWKRKATSRNGNEYTIRLALRRSIGNWTIYIAKAWEMMSQPYYGLNYADDVRRMCNNYGITI